MISQSSARVLLTMTLLSMALPPAPLTAQGLSQGTDEAVEKESVEARRARFESAESPLPYRLLRPAVVEPSKRYPLVVFLHGAGERGDNNQAQLKHSVAEFARSDRQANFPCYVLAPQCPTDGKWVEVDWSLKKGSGSFESATSPVLDKVLQIVDSLIEQEPVDAARIYVTGLSMGGYGSWYAAAKWPEKFAAAIPVCGGGDPTWANRYQGVAIWAFHGQADSAVPVARSREVVSAIAMVGHAPEIRYTEYPEVGHDSWTQSYIRDDVFSWLFAQHR